MITSPLRRAPLLLVLAALLASPLAARPGERPGPRHGARAVAEYLGLDERQKAAARELIGDFLAEARPLVAEQRARREELRARLASGASEDEIGRLVIEIHRQRERLRAEREKREAAFAALLDERQRVKWEALREWRRARRPGALGPAG